MNVRKTIVYLLYFGFEFFCIAIESLIMALPAWWMICEQIPQWNFGYVNSLTLVFIVKVISKNSEKSK